MAGNWAQSMAIRAPNSKIVGIIGAPLSIGHRRMFAALSELFDVRFEERALVNSSQRTDALIFTFLDREMFSRMVDYTVPCFAVLSESGQSALDKPGLMEFARHPAVPAVLAGRQVRATGRAGSCGLPAWLQGATPLASKGGIPTWTIKELAGRRFHFVTENIPELSDDEPVFLHFDGNQFPSVLPLLAFLREVSEDPRWQAPPLQACFMFDDPNLHWRTYGFIDYPELVTHAKRYNYHVAFATIPLDGWFVHAPTATLFKENPAALSLLMHGNDHVSEELARVMETSRGAATLRLALKRIQRMERFSQVQVSRVMAPPHGACSEQTLEQMALAGYDGACISRGSLRRYNRHASWIRTVGMRPCDVIRGLTVVPRFRISGDCHNSILTAAFLRQPIVPVGHHRDLAEGPELLSDLAQYVNSLGIVQWGNMTSILRSQYSLMHDRRILRLRMHTKQAEIVIPQGVDRIIVERPWLVEEANESLTLCGTGIDPYSTNIGNEEPFAVLPGRRVHIISGLLSSPLGDDLLQFRPRPWPIVRRVMTEVRDRITPILWRPSKDLPG